MPQSNLSKHPISLRFAMNKNDFVRWMKSWKVLARAMEGRGDGGMGLEQGLRLSEAYSN